MNFTSYFQFTGSCSSCCCWLPLISRDHGYAPLVEVLVAGAAPVVTVQAYLRVAVTVSVAAPVG